MINKGQIGFSSKCRTTDHLFTLQMLINKHVRDMKGKQVYACFVDFKKGYDSIWNDGLFFKLENMQINGPFLHLVRDIYSKSSCVVKIGNKCAKFLDVTKAYGKVVS